jgi:hypothetical protein
VNQKYAKSPADVGEARVRQAAHPSDGGGVSAAFADIHVLSGVYRSVSSPSEQAQDARAARLAGMRWRRVANHHACTGKGCTSRNHRRDLMALALLLDACGIDPATPPPTQGDYEGGNGFYATVDKGEVQEWARGREK